GIRDATVTGVQTCALPISCQPATREKHDGPRLSSTHASGQFQSMLFRARPVRQFSALTPFARLLAATAQNPKRLVRFLAQGQVEIGRASCRERAQTSEEAR